MNLPEISLPNIELPFDIPVLLHPSIDHFAIVLPVVVLLLEIYNLFAKRKSIGLFSFMMLVLTMVVFAAAYLTGVVDGKESYDLLSTEGQNELKEHKLLGIYLLFGTVALLLFKLLSMTGKKVLKILYFILLFGFVFATFKQGQDGGELVYKHGANVQRVKILDDKLFDANEALEDAQSQNINSAKLDKSKSDINPAVLPKDGILDTEKQSTIKKEESVQSISKELKENNGSTVQSGTSSDNKISIEPVVQSDNKLKQVEQTHIPKNQKFDNIANKETTDSLATPNKKDTPDKVLPTLPEVPKAVDVQKRIEVPKTKESLENIVSDMEKIKIQTH